ncbi:hypothetical protein Q0N12_11860 [Rossellomorea marisflavi]|uniref:hypothetical protein n=1 Tax=Rossellomorea marisflavi TaxID=189381 RepID=UPI00345ACE4F
MNTFKESIWLARYDFRHVVKQIAALIFVAGIYGYFFADLMEGYLEKTKPVFDLFFFLYLFFMPSWSRSKESQVQQIEGDLYAAPTFMLFNQLPIRKNVVIISRFFCLFVPVIIGTVLVLVVTYIASDVLREVLSVGGLVVLTLFWTGIALASCSAFATMEAGERISKLRMVTSFIWLILIAGALFILMKDVLKSGILKWSIFFTADHPLVMLLLALLIPIGASWWAYRRAYKQMNKMDYM